VVGSYALHHQFLGMEKVLIAGFHLALPLDYFLEMKYDKQ